MEEGTIETLESLANSLVDKAISKNKNTCYVIGNNGCGKSRLLREIAIQLIKKDKVSAVICLPNTLFDRFFDLKNRKKIHYHGYKNVSNAIFHSNISRELTKILVESKAIPEKVEKILGLKFKIYFGTISDKGLLSHVDTRGRGKEKGKKQVIDDFLDKQEQETIQQKFFDGVAHEFTESVVTNNVDVLKKFLKLRPDPILKIQKQGDDRDYDFDELSSGEQNRIMMALKISLYTHIEAGSDSNIVILIDEPEVSLHLKWQMEHPNFLKEISGERENIRFIVATHSPIIVSEAFRNAPPNSSDIVVILESIPNKNSEELKCQQLEIKSPDDMRKFKLNSFDGFVFSLFETVPYKTSVIEERIAEVISRYGADADDSYNTYVIELEKIKIQGMTEDQKLLVDRAISCLKNYANRNN